MGELDLRAIAELNGLLDEHEDPRDCYAIVHERIESLKQAGEEVPEDLTLLKNNLLKECWAESQGR